LVKKSEKEKRMKKLIMAGVLSAFIMPAVAAEPGEVEIAKGLMSDTLKELVAKNYGGDVDAGVSAFLDGIAGKQISNTPTDDPWVNALKQAIGNSDITGRQAWLATQLPEMVQVNSELATVAASMLTVSEQQAITAAAGADCTGECAIRLYMANKDKGGDWDPELLAKGGNPSNPVNDALLEQIETGNALLDTLQGLVDGGVDISEMTREDLEEEYENPGYYAEKLLDEQNSRGSTRGATLDTEAQAATTATSDDIAAVRNDMNKMDDRLSSGIASAMAMSGIVNAAVNGGELSFGGAFGNYNGQSAGAFGAAIGITNSWSINGAASVSSYDTGVRVGTNYKIKMW
jgi:autotransporter adhesin